MRRKLLWPVFWAALMVHLVGLYLPGDPAGQELFPLADKVWHLISFAVPGWLAVRLTDRAWPLAAFAAHAVVSEVIQYLWVPYRAGDPADLLADLAGLTLAWLVWRGQRANEVAASSSSVAGSPNSRTRAADRRPKP